MKDGQKVKPGESVRTVQERCRKSVEALKKGVRSFHYPDRFDVRLSDGLAELNRMIKRSSVD